MIKSADPEFRIQAAFIQYVELMHPTLLYTISPAGFIMSAGMGMKMVRMGYRKGTPDITFYEPRGSYHGLLIEFKAPGGTVSDAQKDFIQQADDRGYKTAICFSTAQGIAILDEYLRLPIPLSKIR
jgi:hypothetical protein